MPPTYTSNPITLSAKNNSHSKVTEARHGSLVLGLIHLRKSTYFTLKFKFWPAPNSNFLLMNIWEAAEMIQAVVFLQVPTRPE